MVRKEFETLLSELIKCHGIPILELMKTMEVLPGQPFPSHFYHQIRTMRLLNGAECATYKLIELIILMRNNDVLVWLMVAADVAGNEKVVSYLENQLNNADNQQEAQRILENYRKRIVGIREFSTAINTSSNCTVVFDGDWPDSDSGNFLPRVQCDELISRLQSLLSGPPGALVLHGAGGVGKTTMAIFTLRHLLNDRLAAANFGHVRHVVWLNVFEISSAHTFDEQRFVERLHQLLIENTIIESSATVRIGNMKAALEKSGEKLLFVADDVYNIGILRCFSKLGRNVRVLALTRNRIKSVYRSSWFTCKCYEIPLMSHEEVQQILVDIHQLPQITGLDVKYQIPRLVKVCAGLPLIAAVIKANFAGQHTRAEIEDTFWRLVRNVEVIANTSLQVDKVDQNRTAEMTVSSLLTLSSEFNNLAEDVLEAFLIFEPGQTVESADLQILWGLEDDFEVRHRCEPALESSFLISTCDSGYILHDLLHNALCKFMIEKKAIRSVWEARRTVARQCLQIKRTKNILTELICNDRSHLLNSFVQLCDPKEMAHLATDCNFEALKFLFRKLLKKELWLRFIGKPREKSELAEILCMLLEFSLQAEIPVFADKEIIDSCCANFSSGLAWYENILFNAIHYNCTAIVTCLLQHPETSALCSNIIDNNGDTALIYACKMTPVDFIVAQLSAHINPNHRNNRGETALWHTAKWNESLKRVRVVMSNSKFPIDVNISDSASGNTVLHNAIIHGRFDLVKFLVAERGADISLINKTNDANATELALVICRQKEIGEWLLNQPECVMSNAGKQAAISLFPDLKLKIEITKVTEQSHKAIPLTSFEDGKFTSLHSAAFQNDFEQIKKLKENERSYTEMQLTYDALGRTPLIYSCFDGFAEIVEMLLPGGADAIDHQDQNGYTALHIACQQGHTKISKLLIDGGASVHVQTNSGESALCISSKHGNEEIARLLLNHGADPNVQSNTGETAMYCASKEGQLQILRMLLDRGADVNLSTNNGETSLYIASQQGHVEIVRLLLDCEANVDFQSNCGATALYIACQQGFVEIVKLLLDWGANVDLQINNGETSLYIASQLGRLEIARLLLDRGATVDLQEISGTTALYIASQEGHIEIVFMLLERGGNVDLQTNTGSTALHMSSKNSHAEIVRFLGDHGANVDLQTNAGVTALHIACGRGSHEIVKLLLDFGANTDLQQNNGETSLYIASQQGHVEIVRLLLDCGANVDVQSNCGATALYIACQQGFVEIVKLLLDWGANVDLQINNGETSLYIASQLGHLEIVRLLLDHGAWVDSKTNTGSTALHISSLQGHLEIVKILLSHGADAGLTTNTGDSCFLVALRNRHYRVALALRNPFPFL